jgi:outer membrane protein assembly factor BamB
MGDWMHMNSTSLLGPNKLFDNGDTRFHPDNIIWSGRETNILGITEKKTGEIVWQVGPDYTASPELRKLGQIIGPHHVHLIPRGLPGEGNILVFDNGGWAGYGSPNPGSPNGHHNALRDNSRVIEFNPLTLEIAWQYPAAGGPEGPPTMGLSFYSPLVSSAQRLPNGNTLITEGLHGRLFEVTSEGETVWEYVNPFLNKQMKSNGIYRAYRAPYHWVPQVDTPVEKALPVVNKRRFRVAGSVPLKTGKSTAVHR